MKRFLSLLMILILALSFCALPAYAEDSSRDFLFELAVDGSDRKEAEPGDLITVVFTLRRQDGDEAYPMYAMQNEIRYDPAFFELVEGSELLGEGVEMKDLGLRDGQREIYMNYLSLSGGKNWNRSTTVGSFQLRVVGENGSSRIQSTDYLVSTADGSDHYKASAQDVTVIVTGDCVVHFVTNGAGELADVTVPYGEKLKAPELKRPGYTLEGWYQDMDLTKPWNFDDPVESNMTLYARWTEGEAAAGLGLWWLWLLLILLLLAAAAYVYYRKKKQGKH